MSRAQLIEVQGDQIEFADLIGTFGILNLNPNSSSSDENSFQPDDRGDWLAMEKKTVSRRGNKVIVSTRLGNVFTFREQ